MIRKVMLTAVLSLTCAAGAWAAPAGPVFKGDPQAAAEIRTAFQKFAAERTWRARMTAGGRTQTMEHVAPDRYHMALAGGGASDMYLIGSEAWMRHAGVCRKLPAAMPVTNPAQAMEQGSDAVITVTRGGPATIDGTPTQSYLMTVDTHGQQLRETVYVATGTGLPRRIEMQSGGGATVLDYLDYNAPITINDPPC